MPENAPEPDGLITPLDRAIEALWVVFSDKSSLLPDLAVDAVLSRADAGELRFCLPRLVELLTNDDLGDEGGFVVTQRLARAGWQSWERVEREALEAFFDTWWRSTLMFDDGRFSASEVLGILVYLEVPLVRWLGPWLDSFDGPGARHFASMVLDGSDSAAWGGMPDERSQVEAWAASEACVLGIALVGGVHLEDGQLSEVLDRLV